MPDPISWSYSWPYLLAALAIGYGLGSIPFGLVLTRLAGYGDIRKIGSGNIGATNVLRTGNRPLALATLILDSGKGAIAVFIAWRFGPDVTVTAAAGAMLGHLFPVWLGFRGGKGVATALGTLLALVPAVGALACLTWLATAAAFRYSSLAALVAMALSPLYAYLLAYNAVGGAYLADPQRAELTILIAVLVIARHHGNIRRLLAGREPKIGKRDTPNGG